MKDLKTDEAKAEYKALEEELKKFDHLKPKPLLKPSWRRTREPKAPAEQAQDTQRRAADRAGLPFDHRHEPRRRSKPTKTSTGRRTALADWITRPDNQLSTRVIVNRVWQYHFGRGIVATASEFGKLGELPTHPELLDYLTSEVCEAGGWHLKPLHREIMLSATYRQTARREPDETAAKVDPSNRYLWRFNPRRLDAEQVRDALLAVSGELDPKPGGPAGDGNGTRRSVYTMKKRNSPNELLRALDMPPGLYEHRRASEHHDADAGAATAQWRLVARPRPQARLTRGKHRRCVAGCFGPSADGRGAGHGGRLSQKTCRGSQPRPRKEALKVENRLGGLQRSTASTSACW
jgi:hypothetical protein